MIIFIKVVLSSMMLKSSRKWFILVVMIVILSLLAGCSPAKPTAQLTKISPVQTVVTQPATIVTSTAPVEPLVITRESVPVATSIPTETSPCSVEQVIHLTNPGFEEQKANGIPSSWTSTGFVEAAITEEKGHTGDFRLTHKSSGAYIVDTSQEILGLAPGWYTLRTWARSSGGQNEVYIALKCGSEEERAIIPPTTPGYRWIQVVVSNQATDGQCLITLHSDANQDAWASFDDIELVTGRAMLTILGADISSLKKSEDLGGVYKYSDGKEADALQILKDHGMNYARLRVWVNPVDGYHGKEEILTMALRLKAMGIKLLVDFHYSDNWADPGKQIKPAAWKDLDFEHLKKAVYEHTYDICNSLVAQDTPPDMVQIGNEINAGMLWPDGDYQHFDNLAALLSEGYRAVKDCSETTLVMLHIAEGGDNDMARWWFDNITRRDVPFDVIGISYYPFWHGNLAQLQFNLNNVSARYGKDVIVVETAYAFTDQNKDSLANIVSDDMAIPGYPLTPEGQRDMLRDIMSVVRAVPGGRGLGIFYWDATWTAVPGNGWESTDSTSGNAWENQALFDFDSRALPAMEEFSNP